MWNSVYAQNAWKINSTILFKVLFSMDFMENYFDPNSIIGQEMESSCVSQESWTKPLKGGTEDNVNMRKRDSVPGNILRKKRNVHTYFSSLQ